MPLPQGLPQASDPEYFTCKVCGELKTVDSYYISIKGYRTKLCRKCAAARRKALYKKNSTSAREQHLLRRYHMTVEDYELLLEKQDRVCAVCKNPPKTQSLHVDHDPKCCPRVRGEQGSIDTCGKCIRGLVCYPCNGLLGKIENGYLDSFYSYLAEWRQ